MAVPTNDAQRKRIRVYEGFIKYFPDAIAAVAELSVISNEKHNPGEPLHWSKGKSSHHRDSAMRHTLDQVEDPLARDYENGGVLHATEIAWRWLAHLQTLADAGHNIFAEPDPREGYADSIVQPAPIPEGYHEVNDPATGERFIIKMRD